MTPAERMLNARKERSLEAHQRTLDNYLIWKTDRDIAVWTIAILVGGWTILATGLFFAMLII